MMRHRSGLSLLEVILAIAIFGGSLAVIGELIRLGTRSAMEARELTTAQLYCESKMAEVASGIIPQQPIGLTPIDIQNPVPEWYYTVEVAQTDREGLLGVYVMVIKNPDLATTQPISFSLVRWMKDAALVAQGNSEDLAAMEEAAMAESEAASASSGSSSGGSAGGGTAAGVNTGGAFSGSGGGGGGFPGGGFPGGGGGPGSRLGGGFGGGFPGGGGGRGGGGFPGGGPGQGGGFPGGGFPGGGPGRGGGGGFGGGGFGGGGTAGGFGGGGFGGGNFGGGNGRGR